MKRRKVLTYISARPHSLGQRGLAGIGQLRPPLGVGLPIVAHPGVHGAGQRVGAFAAPVLEILIPGAAG